MFVATYEDAISPKDVQLELFKLGVILYSGKAPEASKYHVEKSDKFVRPRPKSALFGKTQRFSSRKGTFDKFPHTHAYAHAHKHT